MIHRLDGLELPGGLCDDCPPIDYPTDKTRCLECPWRVAFDKIVAGVCPRCGQRGVCACLTLRDPINIKPESTMPHPDHEPILQFFAYSHLPERLARVSRPFGEMAHKIVRDLPRNPERTVALRKLLEAKDAAVRAELYTAPGAE